MISSDIWFLKSLLNQIVEDCSVPKLQVERIVGAILSIFIEEIFNEHFKNDVLEGGPIQLVTKELPLKKEKNDQSENCDFFLANRKYVYLTELKTSIGSFNYKQFELYKNVKKRIQSVGSAFILEEINKIAKKNKRYQLVINKIKDNTYPGFDSINKCKIIYIGPSKLKNKLDMRECDFLSLIDISSIAIGNDSSAIYKENCWKEISNNLKQIDAIRCN
jgi:hypothetical protein